MDIQYSAELRISINQFRISKKRIMGIQKYIMDIQK